MQNIVQYTWTVFEISEFISKMEATCLKGRLKSILYKSLNVLQVHGGYFINQVQVNSIWIIAEQ